MAIHQRITPTPVHPYRAGRSLSDIGLMDYNARFYDPLLGRFTSPDSIIPDPGSVIRYNRFAYVANNPMIYTDPSGHGADGGIGDPACGPNDFLCQTVWDPYNPDADFINTIFALQNPSITDPGGVASTAGWDTDPGRSFSEILYDISIETQNLATSFSTMGMEIELGVGVVGCVLGAEQGVIPGCVEGLIVGNSIHRLTTGEIESLFSTVSLGATLGHSLLEQTTYIIYDEKVLVIDEDLATSISTALLGFTNIGTIDYIIDSYASSYNEGNQPGVYEIIENRGTEVYGTRIAIYNLATVNKNEKEVWGWIQFGESK